MTNYAPLIFDLVILAALIIFACVGAARGLILSLCSLLAVLIAFVGAGYAARTFSPMVAQALEPKFAAVIEERLDAEIQATQTGVLTGETPEELPLQSVLNVLKDMGFYESLVDTVNNAVKAGMLTVAASAAAAVAAAIAQSVAYLIIFLVVFGVILLVWTLISHALDLVAKLPGLHFLNKTGGALFGLVKGCIFFFVLAWLLQYLGNLVPEETVRQTHLLQFFMKTNPFSLLPGAAL